MPSSSVPDFSGHRQKAPSPLTSRPVLASLGNTIHAMIYQWTKRRSKSEQRLRRN